MTTTSPTSDLPDTGSTARAFKPGPGFYVLVGLIVLTIVLALSAAITSALGATETSRVLGGIALVLVGLGMLASLRLSARSLVVNAPRLRLERNRVRAAQARQLSESSKKGGSAKGARGKGAKGSQSSQRSSGTDGATLPGTDLATLTVPGTKVLVPESTGRRELTTLDVVSGPVTTALAATSFGRAADERLADVLEEMGDEDRIGILSSLDVDRAADVLDAMQPDDAADLVADLPQLKATELLGLMEPEEAEDVRRLMAYDDYTAGGLMTTEPIILPPESTVATFLAQSRKAEVPPALAAVGFVCRPPLESPTGKFVGMIHFQRALRERPQRLVGSIVDTDVDSVRPEDSIGTVTRLLATYNLTALPVLDDAGRLLGAVSVDDVLDHLMPDDWRVADEAVTDETIERGANA